ncbi:hypothetical protein F528_0776 [Neisseria meningitidis 992008]|nr:hypothetical protein F528_0776 [Neisseria meningitidis 992008]
MRNFNIQVNIFLGGSADLNRSFRLNPVKTNICINKNCSLV